MIHLLFLFHFSISYCHRALFNKTFGVTYFVNLILYLHYGVSKRRISHGLFGVWYSILIAATLFMPTLPPMTITKNCSKSTIIVNQIYVEVRSRGVGKRTITHDLFSARLLFKIYGSLHSLLYTVKIYYLLFLCAIKLTFVYGRFHYHNSLLSYTVKILCQILYQYSSKLFTRRNSPSSFMTLLTNICVSKCCILFHAVILVLDYG